MDEVDGAPNGDARPAASESACAPNAGAPPKPDMSSPAVFSGPLLCLPGGLLDHRGRCRVPHRRVPTRCKGHGLSCGSSVVVEDESLALYPTRTSAVVSNKELLCIDSSNLLGSERWPHHHLAKVSGYMHIAEKDWWNWARRSNNWDLFSVKPSN